MLFDHKWFDKYRTQRFIEKYAEEFGLDNDLVKDAPRSLATLPARAIIDIDHKWEMVRNVMANNPAMPLDVAMSRVAAMFTVLPLDS